MKNLLFLFSILFILCISFADAQSPTDAGIPESQHVLVVYKQPIDENDSLGLVSEAVKNYYVSARNIPSSNIVRLPLPDSIEITIENETHWVGLRQETDIIRDIYQHNINAVTPKFHAWKYFLNFVAIPIKNWITSHNLTSTIRYIVLCKGVPFKIQAAGDWPLLATSGGNVTVDGLLCMLNTDNYESFIENTVYRFSKPNPYYNVDPNFTMEHRFLPDHYTGNNYKLSYLVSHLDGISYDMVKGIIDRSINTDMSGTAAWVIDDDPTWSGGHFADAREKLEELGFNVVFDSSNTWITSHSENVMGYTSWGTHAEDGNCEWEDSAWVKDSLHFNLANGSVFNTYESFNGNSLTTLKWRYVTPGPECNHTQGLATQFTEIGGTATMGHAWEPGGSGLVANNIFFPAYAIGYNLIDAVYQGMNYLAHQNVVVGDPLTRIYECENTVITTNSTIGSGDYECDVIVPQNVTLIIESGSVVNFRRNASLKVYGSLIIESNDTLNFSGFSELIIDSTGTMTQNSGSWLVFNGKSRFIMNNDLELTSSNNFIFQDESRFYVNAFLTLAEEAQLNMAGTSLLTINDKMIIGANTQVNLNNNSNLKNYGSLTLNNESTLNINSSSNFYSYGNVYLIEGAAINQNTESAAFEVLGGVFKSLGSVDNPVNINCSATSTASKLSFSNVDTFQLSYTTLKYGYISLNISDGIQKSRLISITHSIIDSSFWGNGFSAQNTEGVNAALSDNKISVNAEIVYGITFEGFNNVLLERNSIQNSGAGLGKGILVINNQAVEIRDCEILNFKNGIEQGRILNEGTGPINNQRINIYNCTIQGIGYDSGTGISLGYDLYSTPTAAEIELNNISGFSSCIAINIPNNFPIGITNNTISNYKLFGIAIDGGNDVLITGNIITVSEPDAENPVGISVNLVNNPLILDNIISAEEVTSPGDGIFSVSSGGEIRNNTIQYHWHGIELGSSAPTIGANLITDNLRHGIYISNNSHPNLSEQFVGEEQYPLSGYNTIRENGVCNFFPSYSELYLQFGSTVDLEKGCNTIADDREDPALHCNYFYLIDGYHVESEVNAVRNYWGEVNGGDPEGRFGQSLMVDYTDWQTEPCLFDEGETELILTNSKGIVYDTVYSTGITSSDTSDIETRYAIANDYYYHNQYLQAKQEYEGIIQNYSNNRLSLEAYNRLFTLANLMNNSPETFIQLKSFYLQKAGNQSDSIMMGTLVHLSDLCLVSAAEYHTAINNFDEEAQQNSNTDIAFYRQADALTTSLLMPKDSTLMKGRLEKYIANDLSEYTKKLSELIKTRGRSEAETEEEFIPVEYTLYQNFPNPFNPITKIKYSLPKSGNVKLVVYDILGREVMTLADGVKEPGFYEVDFNASHLSSGVYIYRLIAGNYINTKKMLLLK
jgi:uncharacterized protein (TIGR03790 family)